MALHVHIPSVLPLVGRSHLYNRQLYGVSTPLLLEAGCVAVANATHVASFAHLPWHAETEATGVSENRSPGLHLPAPSTSAHVAIAASGLAVAVVVDTPPGLLDV